MKTPLVSIIIPTFNRSAYLMETLHSVQNQTYTLWECIVVDDGSTDDTSQLMQNLTNKDARFKYVKRPQYFSKGANSCRNYGFEISTGDYINWFDDDDVMLPKFLDTKVEMLKNQLKMVIISGYRTNHLLENQQKIPVNPIQTELYRDFVLSRITVLTPSVLFRRDFLTDKELFLPFIKKGQEFELFARLFNKVKVGEYAINSNEYQFLYRSHQNSSNSLTQKYREDFHESALYNVHQNLLRGIERKDRELIQSAYRMLINLYKKALVAKHLSNLIRIKQILSVSITKNKKWVFFILNVITLKSKFINMSFTHWDKFLKKIKIY